MKRPKTSPGISAGKQKLKKPGVLVPKVPKSAHKYYTHGATVKSNFSRNAVNTVTLTPLDAEHSYTNYNEMEGSPQSPTMHDIFPSSTKLVPSHTNPAFANSIGNSLGQVLRGLEEMNDESLRLAKEAKDEGGEVRVRPPPQIWEPDSVIAHSAMEGEIHANSLTPKTSKMLNAALRNASMDFDGNQFPDEYAKEIADLGSEKDAEDYEVGDEGGGGINKSFTTSDKYTSRGQGQAGRSTSNMTKQGSIATIGQTNTEAALRRTTTPKTRHTHNVTVPNTVISLHKKGSKNDEKFNKKISSSYDNTCEEIWIYNYANDKHKYHSESLWAQTTLAESLILVKTNTLPANAIASMCAQMLLDMEDKFASIFGPVVHKMCDDVLNSIFILRNEEGYPSCDAASQIIERNDVFARQGGGNANGMGACLEGVEGSKRKLELFMKCPTYFDQCRYLWGLLKQEIVIRPHCFKKMEQMRKEKLMEGRMIHRSCNHWARGIKFVIFQAWKKELVLDSNRHLLGKYLMAFMQVTAKDVFFAWKKSHKERMRTKKMMGVEEAKKSAELAKKETKALDMANNGQLVANRKARAAAEAVMTKVAAAKEIYEQPARQTPALLKVIKSFAKTYKLFADFQDRENEDHIREQFRIGDDAIRLDPLYKWTGVGVNLETYEKNKERNAKESGAAAGANAGESEKLRPDDLLDAGEYDVETDCDDADEETILKWRPGTFASVEKTPAFHPMSTRAGRRTMRWLNNSLRHFKYDQGEDARRGLGRVPPVREHADLADGRAIEALLVHLANKAEEVHGSCPSVKNAYEQLDANVKREREARVEDCSREFYDKSPQILNIMSALRFCRDNFNTSCRYMEQEFITSLKIPETSEEKAKREYRLAKLAEREKETGIIVHVMSRYMGQRIHVLHVNEPKTFAMLAELFTGYFKDCQAMIDEDTYIKGVYKNELRARGRDRLVATMSDIAEKGAVYYSHERLLELAKEMEKYNELCKEPQEILFKNYLRCLDDRLRYRSHLPELIRLTYQSLCTTLLSRKVRTEEDLDDGTYTTVNALQLKSEFKRIGVISDIAIEEELAEVTAVLKNRIRDLKRIFSFYAAAGDGGPATSMDSSEFWKFVKDCKLQKDRQRVPSVRVDLIFQACNIDYSLVGADRIASDDGELDPGEWVEGLVRLSMYRYVKGTVGKRLEKMLNEDILPNACSLDVDVFRDRLGGDRVKDMFQAHKPNMRPVFSEYAADDQSDGAVDAMDSMNSAELVTFGREMLLVGGPPALSERAMKTLFAFCQQEEEEVEEGENETQSDSEMVYSEFMETNAAIGSQMRPDPYNVLEMRLDQYLNELVHPVAAKLPRFRTHMLKTPERLKQMWLEKCQRMKEKEEAEAAAVVAG